MPARQACDQLLQIDALTRRAKHAEGCYLQIYKDLFEAPDPVQAYRQINVSQGWVGTRAACTMEPRSAVGGVPCSMHS